MWTLAARADLLRETLLYVTCLIDVDRVLLAQRLHAPRRIGRPWLWSQCAVLDGILCALRQLSHYFPPWGTVYSWF
ncbi:hypothetical protein A5481_11280 [Methylobacterium platani]|uniref:Uncharacterized protein n=1 Tax=Methylobacterium platani TaxID=427683 RepID=A0A179SBQ2_9HYPH|nr:hypothetical protein A5481_11280 [Methylobacterium platani]